MINKEKLLISACLAGENVRYDGGNNMINYFKKLQEDFNIQYICPEVQGGMVIPRLPCEITSYTPLKIQNIYGIDNKDHFIEGSKIALGLCQRLGIKYALLKSNSPSCGNNKVYDGTFNNKLIDGSGVTARTLHNHGIKVFNENQISDLYEHIK
jgi:uncharacterized protein YbbK (DUF523 family)